MYWIIVDCVFLREIQYDILTFARFNPKYVFQNEFICVLIFSLNLPIVYVLVTNGV